MSDLPRLKGAQDKFIDAFRNFSYPAYRISKNYVIINLNIIFYLIRTQQIWVKFFKIMVDEGNICALFFEYIERMAQAFLAIV